MSRLALEVRRAPAAPDAGAPLHRPLSAPAVLEAAGPLVALARDLTSAERPGVRGVALASWLVCDCAGSPRYDDRARTSAREIAAEARAALAGA